MAKKVTGFVKLQIAAGKATPAPPVGPALGQAQINIMEFCKQFNARTNQKEMEGLIIPVVVSVYSDRSFTFITKTPPASILLKRAAGIAKGSGTPNKDKVGKVTLKQVEDIAKQKMPDLNAASIEAAVKSIRGTARSMGIEVGWDKSGAFATARCGTIGAEPSLTFEFEVENTTALGTTMGGGRRGKCNEKRRKEHRQGARRGEKRPYLLQDAVPLLQKVKFAKFDETVEITLRLGVDPKHADQMVRGTVVSAARAGQVEEGSGDRYRATRLRKREAAGADFFGGEEMVEKITKENWTDFDALIATPDVMKSVGRLGKVLGPKGLMPNPKTGTVTFDVAKAVQEVKAGKVEFRTDKTALVHCAGGQDFVLAGQVDRECDRADHQRDQGQAVGGQGQVHQGLLL